LGLELEGLQVKDDTKDIKSPSEIGAPFSSSCQALVDQLSSTVEKLANSRTPEEYDNARKELSEVIQKLPSSLSVSPSENWVKSLQNSSLSDSNESHPVQNHKELRKDEIEHLVELQADLSPTSPTPSSATNLQAMQRPSSRNHFSTEAFEFKLVPEKDPTQDAKKFFTFTPVVPYSWAIVHKVAQSPFYYWGLIPVYCVILLLYALSHSWVTLGLMPFVALFELTRFDRTLITIVAQEFDFLFLFGHCIAISIALIISGASYGLALSDYDVLAKSIIVPTAFVFIAFIDAAPAYPRTMKAFLIAGFGVGVAVNSVSLAVGYHLHLDYDYKICALSDNCITPRSIIMSSASTLTIFCFKFALQLYYRRNYLVFPLLRVGVAKKKNRSSML